MYGTGQPTKLRFLRHHREKGEITVGLGHVPRYGLTGIGLGHG
jgi:hypothetical protein